MRRPSLFCFFLLLPLPRPLSGRLRLHCLIVGTLTFLLCAIKLDSHQVVGSRVQPPPVELLHRISCAHVSPLSRVDRFARLGGLASLGIEFINERDPAESKARVRLAIPLQIDLFNSAKRLEGLLDMTLGAGRIEVADENGTRRGRQDRLSITVPDRQPQLGFPSSRRIGQGSLAMASPWIRNGACMLRLWHFPLVGHDVGRSQMR